jgi:chromosome partitioning protein
LLPAAMLFRTAIPRHELFVRASARGLPVGALEDGSGAAAVFDSLRAEIQAKLDGGVEATG